jgi:hypothetical protein
MPLEQVQTPPVPGQVALCRWGADEFFAEYIGPDPDWPVERYLMKSRSNNPRFSSGTEVHVNAAEIVQWLAAPPPPELPKFVEQ